MYSILSANLYEKTIICKKRKFPYGETIFYSGLKYRYQVIYFSDFHLEASVSYSFDKRIEKEKEENDQHLTETYLCSKDCCRLNCYISRLNTNHIS